MIFSTAPHIFSKYTPLLYISTLKTPNFKRSLDIQVAIGKLGEKTTFHVQKIHLLHIILIIRLLI